MSMVQVTVRNHGRAPRMRAGVVFPGKVKGQPSERTVQVSKARLREITACRFLELVGEPVREVSVRGRRRKADAEGEAQ